MILWIKKKRGATPLCFPPSPWHSPPPPDRKSPRAYGQRVGRSITSASQTSQGFLRGTIRNRGHMPSLGLLSGRTPVFEEELREEPGRTLGRIVRDHGESFPSTLTNLNRASRKKRSALDQTFCAPRRVLGLATGRQPINGCTREANSALL